MCSDGNEYMNKIMVQSAIENWGLGWKQGFKLQLKLQKLSKP